MSTMVCGKITCDNICELIDLSVDKRIVQYCVNQNVGISFKSYNDNIKDCASDVIWFQLSDGFIVLNCDEFMAPPYYSMDSKNICGQEKLQKDVITLRRICEFCLSYSQIKSIDIYISFGEAEENDYTVYYATVDQIEPIIMKEYLDTMWIPTIKLCLKNNL